MPDPLFVNVVLANLCCVPKCCRPYDLIVAGDKLCHKHCPETEAFTDSLKRRCKWCDMRFESKFVCGACRNVQNKKEWGIVRLLRREIDTRFEYNSSKMLQGCSKKRPDVYFDLPDKCVIVEIDENQHKAYAESCECARVNEIVNGIGGRPVVLIRYNPDTVRLNGRVIVANTSAAGNAAGTDKAARMDLLVSTIKAELTRPVAGFSVRVIQLYLTWSPARAPIRPAPSRPCRKRISRTWAVCERHFNS